MEKGLYAERSMWADISLFALLGKSNKMNCDSKFGVRFSLKIRDYFIYFRGKPTLCGSTYNVTNQTKHILCFTPLVIVFYRQSFTLTKVSSGLNVNIIKFIPENFINYHVTESYIMQVTGRKFSRVLTWVQNVIDYRLNLCGFYL